MSYPLILPDQTLIARSVLAPALSGIGRELDVRARSNRIVTIKSLVCAGMGIGFLSELDVSAEMDARQVKFIPLRDQSLRPPILSVIIARRTKTSVASGILLEYLARELARFNPAPSS
jgi:DNA-binding transcriptional LysR family regulator